MSDRSSLESSRYESGREKRENSSRHPSFSERRLIALPGLEHLNDAQTQNAIRKRIAEGLPRSKRPYDPNRIELVLPADFLNKPERACQQGQGQGHLMGSRRSPAPKDPRYASQCARLWPAQWPLWPRTTYSPTHGSLAPCCTSP